MTYCSLHIGAHKTASTTLQDYLTSQSEQLEEIGACFLGPSKLRRTLTPLVHRGSKPRSWLGAWLRGTSHDDLQLIWHGQIQQVTSSYNRLAISEENILGGCRMLLDDGHLYTAAEVRLQITHDLLPRTPNAVLLCVRNMADFLPSAYCETLRHSASYLPFRRYIRGVNLLSLSWVPLVESVLRIFPEATVYVWRFETFSQNTAAVLRAMFGNDSLAHLAEQCFADRLRSSLSAKAVALLGASSKHLEKGDFPKMRNAFERLFPDNEHNAKFAPLVKVKPQLLERYEKDLVGIRALQRVAILGS